MAHEKFREPKFKSMIKVKYTDGTGNKNVWVKSQVELFSEINAIVNAYMEQDIILTNRQLYYQLVARDIIPNADEIYKRICKFLTDYRYAGMLDWDAIEDRGRIPEKHSEWRNLGSLIQSAIQQYRLPRWKDQNCYIELYCEKQAMESVLKPIADKYHIYFGYNKGYSSASTMYDLAKRVYEKLTEGKRVILLYLGDHDPSGLDMVRDVEDRIQEFLTESEDVPLFEGEMENWFEVIQVALNMTQINRYNPPPNPAKITDPRAKGYIEQYGNQSWELDALKPEVLMELTEEAILDFLDEDKYNAWIEKEDEQKEALIEFGADLEE